MTIKQLFPKAKPALNLDFANVKELDRRITFTRASTGTYVDSDGLIKTAANNEARFDHDPATGESLGLLVEESRTNYVKHSEDISSLVVNNVSITTDALVSPDGTSNADLVEGDGSSNIHFVAWGSGVPAAAKAMSIFAKAGTHNFLQIFSGGTNDNFANFDISAGVVGSVGVGCTASIEEFPNGWFRCIVYASSALTLGPSYGLVTSSTSPRAESNTLSTSVYLWGVQAEVGSFPTSYIPTSGSAETRAADVASITGTNFSSWYNPSESTLLFNAKLFGDKQSYVAALGVTGSIFPFARYLPESTKSRFDIYGPISGGGSASFWSYIYNTSPVNIPLKGALCLRSGDYRSCLNGSLDSAVQSSEAVPSFNELSLGKSGTNSSFMSGHISRIAYYSTRLSDENLQALTL